MAQHTSTSASGHSGHSDQDKHATDGHSHGGLGQYIAVFVALCILTSASFFTTSQYWPFHDTPQIGWAFMMAVSCTKALLVICFFMHLLWEASWKYVLTIPAGMMSVFLLCMLIPDVGMRVSKYNDNRWKWAAEAPNEETSHEPAHSAAHDEHESPHPAGKG